MKGLWKWAVLFAGVFFLAFLVAMPLFGGFGYGMMPMMGGYNGFQMMGGFGFPGG
jgi:hypothetical protein